jgi:hypothetical protein
MDSKIILLLDRNYVLGKEFKRSIETTEFIYTLVIKRD